MADSPIELQTRFGDAINAGDLDAFGDLVAADCVDHDPAPDQQQGPAGYAAYFGTLRRSFPDLHVEVEKLVASGDDVAFAYTVTGTHTGEPFQDIAPSGNGIEIRGLQISRFADGKMVERWGSSDEKTLLEQLRQSV